MGADIYLRSRFQPNHDARLPEFEAAVKAREATSGPHFDKDMKPSSDEQRRVEQAHDAMYAVGYFRDSYNTSSLFSFLGISWWASTAPDSQYAWRINGEGLMSVRSMGALKAFLEDRGEVTCDQMQEWKAREMPNTEMPDDPEDSNSLTAWGRFFERKRRKLIKLLGEAISLKEPLDCSV